MSGGIVSIKSESCLWRTTRREFNLLDGFAIMGVLNVTPDSFSDAGKYFRLADAVKRAEEMVEGGADIIDVGGESTRPGAIPVRLNEELERVIPVVEEVVKHVDIPVSIDTYKSEVASSALEAGAEIVNDISGLRFDSKMADVVAAHDAGLVVMHIKGTPRNMQQDSHYDDLIGEIYDYLEHSVGLAVAAGVARDRIVMDPGIGFGKRFEDNHVILNRLSEFKDIERPILIGPSRKSFIGHALSLPEGERVEGSIAAAIIGLINGARVFRVHDVKATKRALTMAQIILETSSDAAISILDAVGESRPLSPTPESLRMSID